MAFAVRRFLSLLSCVDLHIFLVLILKIDGIGNGSSVRTSCFLLSEAPKLHRFEKSQFGSVFFNNGQGRISTPCGCLPAAPDF